MGSRFADLAGTVKSSFRVGLAGFTLKNVAGLFQVRNAADNAFAELKASKLHLTGNVFDINSETASTGADWLYRIQRPSSGMTAAVTLTLPVDDGTPGQVLSTDGSGVMSWISAASTAAAVKVDSTALAFGSSSPVTMFTTGAGDVIHKIEVIIDTAFDGTPSLSIGISGTTSKYMGTGDVDLTAAAGTVFEVNPGLAAAGAEALIATYAAGGAAAGAARILVHYGTPT